VIQETTRAIEERIAEAVLTMPTAKRKQALASTEVVIPEKIYFRIGEVSELAKLPTYVLRFWETEFPQLRPTKSSTGQRMYRRRDVEFVMQIRKLLYEDGFTIAGARERLREQARANRLPETAASEPLMESPEPEAAKELSGMQTALLFPLPVTGPAAVDREQRKHELLRVRRQLSEVLDLLS
jgi:DNA-binding transcriptional MerR regulator